MAAKYFICTRSQTDGSHTVHKEGCPFLPEPGKRISMGIFKSPHNALDEGNRYFSKPASCLFCEKEHHTESKRPVFSEDYVDTDYISSSQLKVSRESAMFCSVN
ncbi:MAG: hypothetical protein MUO72_05805 [Bacteroidales bacterium]|nr:hypothetical protein [Bacteroidales bacterium]